MYTTALLLQLDVARVYCVSAIGVYAIMYVHIVLLYLVLNIYFIHTA